MAKSRKNRQKNIDKLAKNYQGLSDSPDTTNSKDSNDNIITQTSKHQKEQEQQQEMQKIYLKQDLTKTLIYVAISLIVIAGVYFLTRK